ncbi:MAG: amino acid ABC transporter permease [Lachnospiraceae bacterium]|nr:amino acid ABC transporter permease [Lachnospiraceae bacterium]MCR5024623.1 amino acid ABC transporter permease [Lachnospiraceae bacterium]
MERESFHLDFMLEILPKLIEVLPLTIMMAVFAIVIGCLWGLLLTFCKVSKHRKIAGLIDGITVIVRAVPEVVLIYIVYFGLPELSKDLFGYDMGTWEKPVFVVLALAIELSASSSELFRSAYNSLDPGQLEAAHALGMTGTQKFMRIIYPQGLFVILPNLSGLCLGIIQATSLAYTLGIMDVMGKAKVLDSNAFSMSTFEAYLLVALIYWGLSFIEGWIFKVLEARMGRGMRTVASGA